MLTDSQRGNLVNLQSYFAGVGYGQAIATSSVVSYYTCLIAMSVFYLIASCQRLRNISTPEVTTPISAFTQCAERILNEVTKPIDETYTG